MAMAKRLNGKVTKKTIDMIQEYRLVDIPVRPPQPSRRPRAISPHNPPVGHVHSMR